MGILTGGQVIAGSGLGTPLQNAGAPVDGTTYAGMIAKGGLLQDTTNGILYRNVGTQASPVFAAVGTTTGDLSLTIPLPFTLGNRSGPNSDGVQFGALTHTAVSAAIQEDNSGTSFTDETADANSAAANDVQMPDPFDTDDALYVGYSAQFCGVVINVGTQGAGDAVAAELVFEYWDGDSWEALTETLDDSTGFTAGTSTYVLSFLPPADWATTTVNSQGPFYYMRIRATADDVWNTTQPVLTQLWVLALDAGEGLTVPFAGTIVAADLFAATASATNDDTELLLVNVTQGTFEQITWTGGDVSDRVTGLSLAVAADDVLALVTLVEDGTTEFADGSITLEIEA